MIINDEPRKKYEKIRSLSPSNANKVSSLLAPTHKCKECFRTFKDINNYKEHRFQEHQSTEFPNVRKCSMCSYATLLKSKYDCHMRCHLNNKVIKCHRCPYSTINIRHMSRHERMHMVASNTGNTLHIAEKNSSINIQNHLNKISSNTLKNNKVHKKDAKIKIEQKLKKKRLLLFEENYKALKEANEPSRDENNSETKSTSNNESIFNQNCDKNDANNESLYNLSVVAAATIAAINNTVSNSNNNTSISNNQSSNVIKNQSSIDSDAEKNSATLLNLEMLKNMLLSQIESKKKFKNNEEETNELISLANQNLQQQSYLGNFDNSNYKRTLLENKNETSNLVVKYPTQNLKFNISSITPPSSTSSVSSASSSPNGRKAIETFVNNQPNDINNNLIHQPSQQISDATVNTFYANHLPNKTAPQTSVFSNQNEFTSKGSNHQTAQIESLSFYQSNIEHIIKLQSMSNFNGTAAVPPFFNNFLQNEINSIPPYCTNSSNNNYPKNNYNYHAQSAQLLSQQIQPQTPYMIQDKRKYELASGPLKFECESENTLILCRHRLELEKLRVNVYKLIFNLMPQLIAAFNIDFGSVHHTTHIDTLIDYLINNQNNYKANQI